MGLVGLVNVIALEGAAHGITANGLLPAGSGRMGRGEGLDWAPDSLAHIPPDMGRIAPAMRNEFVTPMVLWLVSERCQATHALYSATAGRFARVFIGATSDWLADQQQPPSAEDIEQHMAEIDDTAAFDMPGSAFDEFRPVIAATLARG
jgi:NAD(P)-dependent dehydrogenase (short-subunit alcohol dehydrogenase family)